MRTVLLAAAVALFFVACTARLSDVQDRILPPHDAGTLGSDFPDASTDAGAPLQPPSLGVQQAVVYRWPQTADSGVDMTPAQVSKDFGLAVFARSYSKSGQVADLKDANFSGPILQYLILNEVSGPAGLESVANETVACDGGQKAVTSYSNNVMIQKGDFCQVHDSIVNHTYFDHDLNPDTDEVMATEDWFLHDGGNARLCRFLDDAGSLIACRPNPGNKHFREYFVARVVREMKGASGYAASGMDGIFLDNVSLSWGKTALPAEYPDGDQYPVDVRLLVSQIHAALVDAGNLPLYGNMIVGSDDGTQWDAWAPFLEGGMQEGFALDWGEGPVSPDQLAHQLKQAASWQAKGKAFLAVGQGRPSAGSYNQSQDLLYSYAALLLVAQPGLGSFHFTNNEAADYQKYWDRPEYRAKLGAPLGPYTVSADGGTWTREFTCGQVRVEVSSGKGQVLADAGCLTPGD